MPLSGRRRGCSGSSAPLGRSRVSGRACPAAAAAEFQALWEEYTEGESAEARLVKTLDKAETILQHNQGANPPDFDYAFNLTYGTAYFQGYPLLEALREELDAGTRARLCEGENNSWKGETR